MPRNVVPLAASRLVLLVNTLSWSVGVEARAAEPAPTYQFQSIIDSTSGYVPQGFSTQVNRLGDVAFIARIPLPKSDFPLFRYVTGAYVLQRGHYMTVLIEQAGTGDGPLSVSINDKMQAAVVVQQSEPLQQELYRKDFFGDQKLVADTAGSFQRLAFPPDVRTLIDNRGRVIFYGQLKNGVTGLYDGPGPVANKIGDSTGPLKGLVPQGVRADGTLLFRASKPGGGLAIYSGTDAQANLVFDFGPSFYSASDYVENGRGGIAFIGARHLADGTFQGGIYTGTDPEADAVALATGSFLSVYDPYISTDGVVAFTATLDEDELHRGIFRGQDPVADKIIAPGDDLFGSTVVTAKLAGIDGSNRFYFDYQLADGRVGIASVFVPEPAALGLIAPAVTFLLRRRRRVSSPA